jgi:RluA family pseudouridine synthase
LLLDQHLLAVNKPAGWLVLPDGYDPTIPNLRDHLSAEFGKLWVVHRLDKETSGVLVFTRSASAHQWLNIQFSGRQVEKMYQFLACGKVEFESCEADFPLRVNSDRAHRTVVDPKRGKPAKTVFHIHRLFPGGIVELIACPFTGYTHQIRAHAAAVGFWLLNDHLYHPWSGSPLLSDTRPWLPDEYRLLVKTLPIQRIALHARTLKFLHPSTNAVVEISADFPQDYQNTISVLNQAGQV